MSVSSGTPLFGREVSKKPALYIAAEGGNGFSKRIRAWEKNRGITVSDDTMFLDKAIQIGGSKADVLKLIDELHKIHFFPGLIIVDTLARCNLGGDENSNRDMAAFIDCASMLASELKATLLVVHHLNKSGSMRGASALAAAADTLIEISASGKDNVKIKSIKQKDFEPFPQFFLRKKKVDLGRDSTGQTYSSLVLCADMDSKEKPSEVLEILKQLNQGDFDGVKYSDWLKRSMEKCKVSKATFNRNRKELEDMGLVCSSGEGRKKLYSISKFS